VDLRTGAETLIMALAVFYAWYMVLPDRAILVLGAVGAAWQAHAEPLSSGSAQR
jgi:hypothetical protein